MNNERYRVSQLVLSYNFHVSILFIKLSWFNFFHSKFHPLSLRLLNSLTIRSYFIMFTVSLCRTGGEWERELCTYGVIIWRVCKYYVHALNFIARDVFPSISSRWTWLWFAAVRKIKFYLLRFNKVLKIYFWDTQEISFL